MRELLTYRKYFTLHRTPRLGDTGHYRVDAGRKKHLMGLDYVPSVQLRRKARSKDVHSDVLTSDTCRLR